MAKKKVEQKLSKASAKAVKEFDEAARDWGWTSDQGTGNDVDTSKLSYTTAKNRLIARMLKLETELKQCREILKCEGYRA